MKKDSNSSGLLNDDKVKLDIYRSMFELAWAKGHLSEEDNEKLEDVAIKLEITLKDMREIEKEVKSGGKDNETVQETEDHTKECAYCAEIIKAKAIKCRYCNEMLEPVDDIKPIMENLVKIPSGEFIMGSDDSDKGAFEKEKPQHKVYLDDYYIGIYPVTNSEYLEFIDSGGYEDKEYWSEEGWDWLHLKNTTEPEFWNNQDFNQPIQPVVGINWYEASAYCKWAGGRLPSEAEWEKAVRGTDGRKYPWGDTNCSKDLLNYNRNIGITTPVDDHPKGISPYGCYDMSGNVWEWVSDTYNENYYEESSHKNPEGAKNGSTKALRGGSWKYNARYVRCASRYNYSPTMRLDNLGFRIAVSGK